MRDARVFPVSGGSEANETALKLARAYHLAHGETDRHIVLARLGAYHGNTRGVLDASNRASVTVGYEPWLGQTVRVPLANPYRDDRSGAEHAAEIDRIIRATGPGRVAAFIAEPVSGATLGAVVPPDDYWPEVAAVLRVARRAADRGRGHDRVRPNRLLVRHGQLGRAARHPHVGQGRVEWLLAARPVRRLGSRVRHGRRGRHVRARVHVVAPSGRRRRRRRRADGDPARGTGRPVAHDGRALPQAAERGARRPSACRRGARDRPARRRRVRRRPAHEAAVRRAPTV